MSNETNLSKKKPHETNRVSAIDYKYHCESNENKPSPAQSPAALPDLMIPTRLKKYNYITIITN